MTDFNLFYLTNIMHFLYETVIIVKCGDCSADQLQNGLSENSKVTHFSPPPSHSCQILAISILT